MGPPANVLLPQVVADPPLPSPQEASESIEDTQGERGTAADRDRSRSPPPTGEADGCSWFEVVPQEHSVRAVLTDEVHEEGNALAPYTPKLADAVDEDSPLSCLATGRSGEVCLKNLSDEERRSFAIADTAEWAGILASKGVTVIAPSFA